MGGERERERGEEMIGNERRKVQRNENIQGKQRRRTLKNREQRRVGVRRWRLGVRMGEMA
jgi:hypothetical protein